MIVELFEAWAGVDRSHRKLAARGSRLELEHVSASTVHRVLGAEGLVLAGPPAREPQVRAPWPEWIEWKPGRIWCNDFTHFTRAKRVAVAVLDVVSRRWLSTLVSAEETSTQIEAAFLAALDEEQLAQRIDARLLAQLRAGQVSPSEIDGPEADGVPVLIAISDNGPQMRSHSTKQFMAACAIMQRLRPARHPHRPGLDRIPVRPRQRRVAAPGQDPRPRRPRRRTRPRSARVQPVRLHADIGYVTPDDEHHGRGDAIRRARRDGLAAARPPGPHRPPPYQQVRKIEGVADVAAGPSRPVASP